MRPYIAAALSMMSVGLVACGDPEPARHDRQADPSASVGGGTSSSAAAGGRGGAGGGVDVCAERGAAYQALLDGARPAADAPGAVLAIGTEDCGVWAGATGASTETEPMKPEHVLRIGSITKTFVATTVLELTEEQAVSLDDPISKYVAGLPDGDVITVKQLLNHTSGVFNYTDDPEVQQAFVAEPKKPWTPQELVEVAAAHPPYF